MKITFNSFDCQMNETVEKVTIICTDDLPELLTHFCIQAQSFNPDFVNPRMNRFIFCVESIQWKKFVDAAYICSELKVLYADIETPEDFEISDYFNCNPAIINYILNPKDRDFLFLMESSHRYSNELTMGKIYEALESPKTSGINSLKKFKKFWLQVNGYGRYSSFTTTRKTILKKLSNLFPKTYCWIHDRIICDNPKFSNQFRVDFFICSNDLLHRVDELELPLTF